jgi:hypothetical protein
VIGVQEAEERRARHGRPASIVSARAGCCGRARPGLPPPRARAFGRGWTVGDEHVAEAGLDPPHEVVALLVPHQRSRALDLGRRAPSRGRRRRRGRRRAGCGRWCGCRRGRPPRRTVRGRAGRPWPPRHRRRCAAGTGRAGCAGCRRGRDTERQHAAGVRRVDVGEHQVHAGAAGEVERPVAHPLERPAVGAVVAFVAAHEAHPVGRGRRAARRRGRAGRRARRRGRRSRTRAAAAGAGRRRSCGPGAGAPAGRASSVPRA